MSGFTPNANITLCKALKADLESINTLANLFETERAKQNKLQDEMVVAENEVVKITSKSKHDNSAEESWSSSETKWRPASTGFYSM